MEHGPDRPLIIQLAGMTRVDALMFAWADWRRHGSYDPALRPGDDSWLGRMVKVAKRATGEEKLPPSTMPHYDDSLMQEISELVEELPPNALSRSRVRQCVRERYCGPPWWPEWKKADRCSVSERQYRRNVHYGRELLDACVDWHKIVVVRPSDLGDKLREVADGETGRQRSA